MNFEKLVIRMLLDILYASFNCTDEYDKDVVKEAKLFLQENTLPRREQCIHHVVCKYEDSVCPMECGHFDKGF